MKVRGLRQICLSGVVAATLVLFGWLLLVESADDAPPGEGYSVRKTIQYAFRVKNPTGTVAPGSVLRVFAPVARTATQRTVRVTSNEDFKLLTDDAGNQALEFELGKMAPYEMREISVRAEMLMATRPLPVGEIGHPPNVDQPLRVPSTRSDALEMLARDLEAGTPAGTIRSIYGWIRRNVKAETYLSEDRGAIYAMENGVGDCTEMASLAVSLARATELRARMLSGYVVSQDRFVRKGDFHNWAEIHDGRVWQLVDAQRQVLGNNYDDYVAIQLENGGEQGLLHGNNRFMHDGHQLTVDML